MTIAALVILTAIAVIGLADIEKPEQGRRCCAVVIAAIVGIVVLAVS